MFQAVVVFWLLLDVVVKQLVVHTMDLRDTIPLWDGVFHLTYTRNYGAAFSILQGQLWVFYLAMVALAVIIIWFWAHEKPRHWLPVVGSALVLAGALGNTLDRLATNSVVDMFDLRIINFPIFNVADVGITVGCTLFALWFVFLSGHLFGSKSAQSADGADDEAGATETDDTTKTDTEQTGEALSRPTLRDSIENLLQKWESGLDDDSVSSDDSDNTDESPSKDTR